MNRGKLYVFEGVNGVGKTTQVKLLEKSLEDLGLPVISAREPGGVPIAEEIREFLISLPPGVIKAEEECELYYLARSFLVEGVVEPALSVGKTVILDRFEGSTQVYQGILGGVSFEVLERCRRQYLGGIRPDITFLLDAPHSVILPRIEAQLADFYDRADEILPEEYRRVREAYLWLARHDRGYWKIIDASRGVSGIAGEVLTEVKRSLLLREAKMEIYHSGKEKR